jgi:hypothetical protein
MTSRTYRPRHALSPAGKLLAVASAGLLAVSPALSAPADITESPAPMMGSDPPKAEALREGDASVSTQTGALQYSYPIAVPPGRGGMEPKLALSYSSQGGTYGGIAAGWSLSLPDIRRDTSEGRLREMAEDAAATDVRVNDRFLSTMAGGITPGDMKAYQDLNKGLPDPFPADKVRGPERHPLRTPESRPGPGQERHGHVGPVNHIPIKNGP